MIILDFNVQQVSQLVMLFQRQAVERRAMYQLAYNSDT